MRALLPVLLCTFLPFLLTGQKIKEEYFNYSYVQTPQDSLPGSWTTYTIAAPSLAPVYKLQLLKPAQVRAAIKLKNFRYDPQAGHLVFNVDASPFRLSKAAAVAHTTTNKDKAGKETKQTHYTYDLTYTAPVTVTLTGADGREMGSWTGGTKPRKFQLNNKGTPRFSSKAAAEKQYKSVGAYVRKNLHKEVILEAVARAGKGAVARYDTRPAQRRTFFLYGKGKKVANADGWEANAKSAVAALSAISATEPLPADLSAQLADEITFWTAELAKYDPNDKKQRKLHYAAAYNLTNVYTLLEDPAAAKPYAAELAASSVPDSRGKALVERSETQAERLAATPEGTFHFTPRDVSLAIAPEAGVVTGEETAVVFDSIAGYVVPVGGAKVTGTMVIPQRGASYYELQRTVRFYLDDGTEVALDPAKIEGFGNERGLSVITRQRPHGTLGTKRRAEFMRVIEDGDRARYYRIIKYYADHDPNQQYFIEILGDDEVGLVRIDFGNPRFTDWRKGFASLFAGCEVMYAEARTGVYDNNPTDIARAIRNFNTLSCE